MMRACNACAIRLKLDYLNPNVQWWNRTFVGTTSDTGAIGSHRIQFRRWYALLDGTMRSERIEGHEWGAYVVLVRSSVAKHGIA